MGTWSDIIYKSPFLYIANLLKTSVLSYNTIKSHLSLTKFKCSKLSFLKQNFHKEWFLN